MATTPQMRKARESGQKVTTKTGWSKDYPDLEYVPRHPKDLYGWTASDGRRYRACQLTII